MMMKSTFFGARDSKDPTNASNKSTLKSAKERKFSKQNSVCYIRKYDSILKPPNLRYANLTENSL